MFRFESFENFEFKRVDFNNPMSIMDYGNDVISIANDLVENLSALMKEYNTTQINFSEDIKKVQDFSDELKELQTKQVEEKNTKKLFEQIKKLFNKFTDTMNPDKKCDTYADLYNKYCDDIDNLCKNMAEQQSNTRNLIEINNQFQNVLSSYIKLLENVILTGEEDKNKYIEELKLLEHSSDSEQIIKYNTGKKYVGMFERKLKDLNESLALNKISQMELVEKTVPDMELVMMYDSFINTTAPALKLQASSIVGVQQQKDQLNSQQQVLSTINNILSQNSDTLKENIAKAYEMSSKGNIDTKTLIELKNNTIKTLEDLSSIQQNSYKARQENFFKINEVIEALNNSAQNHQQILLTDKNDDNYTDFTYTYPRQKVLKKYE